MKALKKKCFVKLVDFIKFRAKMRKISFCFKEKVFVLIKIRRFDKDFFEDPRQLDENLQCFLRINNFFCPQKVEKTNLKSYSEN